MFAERSERWRKAAFIEGRSLLRLSDSRKESGKASPPSFPKALGTFDVSADEQFSNQGKVAQFACAHRLDIDSARECLGCAICDTDA